MLLAILLALGSSAGLSVIGYLVAIAIFGIAVWKLFSYIMILLIFGSAIFVTGMLKQRNFIKDKDTVPLTLFFTLVGGLIAFQQNVRDMIGASVTAQSAENIHLAVQQPVTYSQTVWLAITIIPFIVFIALNVKVANLKLPRGGKATYKGGKAYADSQSPITLLLIAVVIFLGVLFFVHPVGGCYNGAITCSSDEKATTYDITFQGEVTTLTTQGIKLTTEKPEIVQAGIGGEEDVKVCAQVWDTNYEKTQCVNIGSIGITKLGSFSFSEPYEIQLQAYGNPDGSPREYNYRIVVTTRDKDQAEQGGTFTL